MNIRRIQKTNNYSIISNEILRRKDLSLKAKGLMSLILSLPDDWELTVNGLVQIVKESKNTIYTILKELNKKGYVERRCLKNDIGQILKWELFIFESPVPKKPEVEKPDMENRSQINTDNKTIKDLKKKTWIEEVEESSYSEELKNDFINFWTEPSKSGRTKQSMQKTWCTKRRLQTWAKRDKIWNKTTVSKIHSQIDNYKGALDLLEQKYERTN